MPAARRYYVLDRAKSQATSLTSYSALNERFWIIDRTTNLPVDEATSRYAARLAAQGWNAGLYAPSTRQVIECQRCGQDHEATYSHDSQHGGQPIYAVVCDDNLTDYYTAELLRTVPARTVEA